MRWPITPLPFALLIALSAGCRDQVQPTGPTPRSALAGEPRTSTDPLGEVHPLPASLEQKVRSLRADLEARGYEVARGYWSLWGAEDCKYPLHSVGFCYGNNPTAPYVIAVVPQWNDEFVDQPFHHAVLAAQRNMSATYRFGEQEALVILAEMPPPARYFGIATNVFTRETSLNATDPIYRLTTSDPQMQSILFATSPDPSRMMMLATIGNSTNNVVMQSRSGSPWLKQRYFVVTPDSGTSEAMTAALVRAGVPSANEVFTEPVAPALVRVGLRREADDFVTYLRYAMPVDSVSGEQWRQQLPLTILRVRPRSGIAQPRPFAIPQYDARTANFDETTLRNDLDALVNAVRARWGQASAPAVPLFSLELYIDLVGQHCLGYPNPSRGPMNCLADQPDAALHISSSLHVDDGQVIAVLGTLGTRTGNATYVSLGVNRFPALVGVANVSDEDLDGSAASFAGALQHDARLFYVYYLARDCTGLHPCLQISRKLVSTGEAIKLMQRDYVNPGSARGADPVEVLRPVTVTLDGRRRPTQ